MKKSIEEFIRENRNEFDTEEPSPELWNRLHQQINEGKNSSPVFRMSTIRWVSAAAVLIFFGMAAGYLFKANYDKPASDSFAKQNIGSTQIISEINPVYAKQVDYLTELITLKQAELKQIEKDQPELYQKFYSDVLKLDSSYNSLQKQLPLNPNREQLLEAMIQNLGLQTELLNQQLMIIKKIKQQKNSDNGNDSETI